MKDVILRLHLCPFACLFIDGKQGRPQGEVDATCVQFGLGGEFPPQGGKNSPDIWVIVCPIYLGILPP